MLGTIFHCAFHTRQQARPQCEPSESDGIWASRRARRVRCEYAISQTSLKPQDLSGGPAMRFGTFSYNQSRPCVPEKQAFAELLEQILLTEDLGFDDAWLA